MKTTNWLPLPSTILYVLYQRWLIRKQKSSSVYLHFGIQWKAVLSTIHIQWIWPCGQICKTRWLLNLIARYVHTLYFALTCSNSHHSLVQLCSTGITKLIANRLNKVQNLSSEFLNIMYVSCIAHLFSYFRALAQKHTNLFYLQAPEAKDKIHQPLRRCILNSVCIIFCALSRAKYACHCIC